tara:strand:+ start:31534 stop:34386 length:2853 start_codon:yes stop_codon:yes gene_type:complete
MSSFNLLDTVLPPEGRYCVIGIGRYPDQHFVKTKSEVEELAKLFVQRKTGAYFGCAKFGLLDKRTHENAKYFRALWMDIDCGPTKGVPDDKGVIKGYLDQQTGLDELKKFCIAVGLPKPILVNSGYGVHAYWLLEETVSRREWEPLANRLRELCVEQGLIVDSSVFEASRVLRIPGTFNFKQEEPKEVTVLNSLTPRIAYQEFKDLLGAPEPKDDAPEFIPRSMSPMMEALMGNKVKRFKTIMLKGDDGCAQLNNCFANQNSVDEPLWRSALSIAAFCIDGDKAAHKLSKEHDGYDPIEVDRKLNNLRNKGGPHHCSTFEKQNPQGCDGCMHRGKIKSPIMLGVEIEEADAEDNEYAVTSEDGEVEIQLIPDYPFPFFRGKNGGVYMRAESEEEEAEPRLVYEHDLYVVKRMRDPADGEVALFRLHLPHDGVKEFSISTMSISAPDELRKQLAHNGVVAHKSQYDLLARYVVFFIKNLQYIRKAETMRTQFGWVEGDSKFILGDREITKDGVFYSPPSSVTKDVAAKLVVKGTMEKWKEAFNMYAKPGLEPHAFAALTAFGSPLLKFTGLEGAIINVIHPESGSGKSTALFMCNSVYGEPKGLTSMYKDTFNAKMHQLGVMNNLPNTIDEITNLSGMEFSDLAYSISQGRGKNKMNGSTNTLRVNNTSWQGMTLCSANASFYEKLGTAKSTPEGESMRLLEYRIEHNTIIDVQLGKQMFDHQLRENFGHAGEIYIQWLVNNMEEAVGLMRKIQARLDKEVQFSQKERFWSAVSACNIAGGLIAHNLGLHNYDMKAVYEWLKGMLGEMRFDIQAPSSTPVTILGEFVNAHINNALVVNGEVDSRSNLQALPMLEPRGELLIRYEPDSKELFIAAKQFKDFCVKQQINYKTTLKDLGKLKIYIDGVNKRMSKGMKVVSPAVRVLKFDASASEFLQMDTLVPTNENRDDNVPN